MNNFLNINEISQKNLESILEDANTLKSCSVSKDQYINSLKNSITGLLFEKPSTRTRISFDLAIKQLGGSSIILNPDVTLEKDAINQIINAAKILDSFSVLAPMPFTISNEEQSGKHSFFLNVSLISNKGSISEKKRSMRAPTSADALCALSSS